MGMTVENEGASPSEAEGQVLPAVTQDSITNLSDEQLNAALNEAEKSEPEQETVSDSVEAPDSEETRTEESTPEEKAKEVGEAETEDEPQETVVVTAEQWKQVHQRLEQQEAYIKQRNTEIGNLRKENREQREKLAANLDDVFDENPRQGLKQQQEIEKLDAEEQRLAQEQQVENFVHQTQKIVAEKLNGHNVDFKGMVNILREEGARPEVIATFEQNPYLTGPDLFIQLAHRANERNMLSQVVHAYKKVSSELEALKSEKDNTPGDLVNQISKSLKPSARMSPSSNGGTTDGKDKFIDPSKMSMEELEAALAQE